ncbi:hypothetical protein BJ322DRAFT_1220044 [Thelephora terrestris]|uniref:DUF6532 domain-containing protein n=1 Tax=Thelephora terrestris TaxID=56493 RepID=A0A9P6L5F6_9AGAM|nr:hypothetical protein BJ322DRAFT_1220044 [Thelephora terrestris]
MPPKQQPTKKSPPNVTKSASSTRRTRAATKEVEPPVGEAGNSSCTVARTQKRKAKDSPLVDQPAKRPNRKSAKAQKTRPLADIQEPVEHTSGTNSDIAEQVAAATRVSKVAGRKAPTRPPRSSDSEDGEEDLQYQTTNGDATSPLPSEDEMDELEALTATQLTEEYPVAVPNGGRRIERLVKEIPVPGPSFQQPNYSLENISDRGALATVLEIHPPANQSPNPIDHTQPILGWPAFTELIQAEDGSYKQTGQITEINNCLSVAVKRANANLVLTDSFPDTEVQEQWLADALKFALSPENQSHVITKVGERARVDINYFNCLLSMIRNRWSGYRQSVLNVARDLVCPKEKEPSEKAKTKAKKDARKSVYKLSGSHAEKAVAAAKLLNCDAFHFARTNADEPDGSAPYQHQAMLVLLGHFFKCDKSLKSRVPTGERGPEVPIPMVALATTLLEVALTEVAEGDRLRFSEEMQRERYFGHINSFEQVKLSKNGGAKLTRLLSTIYMGTMKELLPKGPAGPILSISARPTHVNVDLLPV